MSHIMNQPHTRTDRHSKQDISTRLSPRHTSPAQNISDREQLYSKLGGVALVVAGLTRGKFSGLLMTLGGSALVYRGWTGHCHCYDALGIDTSEHNSATAVPAGQGVKIQKSVIINRSAEELYQFWRKLENLPGIMQHIRRIETEDATTSHWIANAPLEQSIAWKAEIINDRESELIAWRSLPGGDVETAGSVRFEPLGHDRGTKFSVSLKYNPPGGKAVASLAWLFGHGLEQELDADLRRFKSAMEAGEVPTTAGQPTGNCN